MPGDWPATLPAVRARIDALDSELLRLISQRARLAERVAEIKRASAEPTGSFYRPEREAQVLSGIRAKNPGPLADDTVAWLFREIMSACLAHEQPLTVSCLGPVGTFSEQAAVRAFGHGARLALEPGIPEVFRAVAAGAVDFGVVPVENSTEGSVSQTLDALAFGSAGSTWSAGDVLICGEVSLKIDQQLLARGDALDTTPKRIVSHAQSLAQCREWLDVHYPGVERIAVQSNGEAARMAAESPDVYAIGPQLAAERHELQVVAANIQDSVFNTTRFVVIGREAVPPSGQDKTSLVLSINNEPGTLAKLLAPLAEAGIDVTRIESRPARDRAWNRKWDYVFFIDIEGHQDDPQIQAALSRMLPFCGRLGVLGSYPRAVSAAPTAPTA
ncbi:chorismate mutase [Halothiobacillus diazotrophicus]|uniref:Bifunctional chorismate mutase/prephenate dehydratase n=1 Tax=Halothiobacillus diazotrophicus TaxID=1860122 RepID=A0A191ZFV4_9GAMM|nr:chorismate mutase [Halothiobacillus diazotrophicus]